MATVLRPPLVVTKTITDPYPADLRQTTAPPPLALSTAPTPPLLWAASQM